MKRRTHSFHYCVPCKETTRHEEAEVSARCCRCGTVKVVHRVRRASAEERLRNPSFDY